MAVDICLQGVNPEKYDNFVESLVSSSIPTNTIVGTAYADSVISTTSFVMLAVLLIVFLVFVIVVIILISKNYLSFLGGLALVFGALGVLVMYWLLTRQYIKSITYSLLQAYQTSLVKTVAYTANSLLRDGVYLATCA